MMFILYTKNTNNAKVFLQLSNFFARICNNKNKSKVADLNEPLNFTVCLDKAWHEI